MSCLKLDFWRIKKHNNSSLTHHQTNKTRTCHRNFSGIPAVVVPSQRFPSQKACHPWQRTTMGETRRWDLPSLWYRWWLKSGDHQLRLVVFPIIYKVSYIPGGAGFQPSTISFYICEALSKRIMLQRPSTHRINVWYIYLHLVDFYGKCREIYQSHGSYGVWFHRFLPGGPMGYSL